MGDKKKVDNLDRFEKLLDEMTGEELRQAWPIMKGAYTKKQKESASEYAKGDKVAFVDNRGAVKVGIVLGISDGKVRIRYKAQTKLGARNMQVLVSASRLSRVEL